MFILSMIIFDYSSLTHFSYTAKIIDKVREESCTRDEDGTETCERTYTVTLLADDQKFYQSVSRKRFYDLPTDSQVFYSYDEGRLGFKHNSKIQPIQ
ncbi:MAG: hypothetical protein F6K62_16610 [Sphaerospermopsis sp. SIO1G2]|nr:hypothetical protein [Sphaerospermopsis sp. SIO1G1]NET72488.1 hypothetical protein [Sphaerospermopsis sp. SIO1G2]